MFHWCPGELRRLLGLAGCLALGGCDSSEHYIELLQSPDPEVRKTASFKLLLRGRTVVPRLLKVLEQGPDSTRYIAVQLLGKIGDGRALEPLLSVLQQDSLAVLRQEAAAALGKIGDGRALGPLAGALRRDPEEVVRREAARALANLRPEDLDPLVEALEDSAALVRRQALLALVRRQYQGLPSQLLRLVEDPDARVRYVVVQLLGRQGGEEAVAALIAALEDPSGGVRQEAALALGRLKALRAREALIDLMARSRNPDGDAARRALREITGVEYRAVE